MLAIGHRGAPSVAVENSLQSLRAAIDGGADGVEVDVQLSADGELFVFHDDDLDRLTGARGPAWRCTWAQLRSERARTGALQPQPIAHVDELLQWWADARCTLNVELKVADGLPDAQVDRMARALAKKLEALAIGTSPLLVASSFSRRALLELAGQLPPTRCGALIDRDDGGEWRALLAGQPEPAVTQIHPPYQGLRDDRLARLALPVWVWTVNSETQWDDLCQFRGPFAVQAAISDRPADLRRFLEKNLPATAAA